MIQLYHTSKTDPTALPSFSGSRAISFELVDDLANILMRSTDGSMNAKSAPFVVPEDATTEASEGATVEEEEEEEPVLEVVENIEEVQEELTLVDHVGESVALSGGLGFEATPTTIEEIQAASFLQTVFKKRYTLVPSDKGKPVHKYFDQCLQ